MHEMSNFILKQNLRQTLHQFLVIKPDTKLIVGL
jgi:hypothetical protein